MDSDSEALIKFGHEVLKLLALFREAQETMSDKTLQAFNVQFLLVDAMAQVAVLPVTLPFTREGQ